MGEREAIHSAAEQRARAAATLTEKARQARRAIGAMLLVPGALDPDERRELELAQDLVGRFVR